MKTECQGSAAGEVRRNPPGIVIHDRREVPQAPLITAFIWGGKVRPFPTLPFGRWKPKAA